jgi:hypothetical protein
LADGTMICPSHRESTVPPLSTIHADHSHDRLIMATVV